MYSAEIKIMTDYNKLIERKDLRKVVYRSKEVKRKKDEKERKTRV